SRVVMPRAYIDRILPSKPAMRVWPFGMIWGSNVGSRSRGVMTSISPNSPFKVVIRTTVAPQSLESAVRSAFLAVDPTQPVYHVRPLADYLADSLAARTFTLALLGL